VTAVLVDSDLVILVIEACRMCSCSNFEICNAASLFNHLFVVTLGFRIQNEISTK
jgi:uncharacterized protein (DUF952 family)